MFSNPAVKDKQEQSSTVAVVPEPSRSSTACVSSTVDYCCDKDDVDAGNSIVLSCSSIITSSETSNTSSDSTNTTSVGKLSQISATSPRRVSKDGAGGPSQSKGRLRLDSEGKPKIKPESSSSDRFKSEHVIKNPHQYVVANIESQFGQRASSHDNPLYVRHNRYSEELRHISVSNHARKDNKPSTASAIIAANQPCQVDGKESQVYRSHTSAFAAPKYQADHKLSCEYIQHQEVPRAACYRQEQSLKPLHGILKDSCNNASSQIANINYYQKESRHSRDNPYFQNSQHISRTNTNSSRADPLYQKVCRSLPGSSRTATPENAYNYGSFPVRPNTVSHTQHNLLYDKPDNWGQASHKAESDSGFSIGSIDRENNYAVINYKKSIQRLVEHTDRTYAAASHSHQPPRPDSVPASRRDSPDSLYSVNRPGSLPPQYYSDTETTGGYRGARPGSVPVGYEPGSTIHSTVGAGNPRQGNSPRNYETASDYASGSSSSIRVDKKYRAGLSKRPIPRRHTLSYVNKRNMKEQETEKKREAFMELLAQRYPQYADKIQRAESPPAAQIQQQDKPSRVRDGQRRRTAVVTYNPNQASNTLEYDDLGTMSDLELPSFQRGGLVRTSMPIVRSASTSLERPLGLVFLVYGDQTKKSMLPNEITTLDTVRALFVRAFPDLTLEMLENPRKKIYLLDPATNIYFQLEDLMDIKDRSVLKIHETDSDQPQKVRERQEVRGRTVQMPVSRQHSQHAYGELPIGHDTFTKSQSLPPQVTQNYSEVMQDQRNIWEFERRSRSRTPELAERPRSLSAGAPTRQRFSHSPDRLPTPERVPLNPIPENRQLLEGYREQGNYYETVGPGTYRGQYPSGIYESPVPYQGYPPSQGPSQQTYIARSTRAPTIAHPQRAIAPGHDIRESPRGSNANRHSLAFAPMSQAAVPEGGFQHSQNYRIPPAERDGSEQSHSVTPADDMTSRNRIEKMEQQLANLTAWVHCQTDGTRRGSNPQSLGSSTSDGSDNHPASSTSKHKGETPSLSTIATLTEHVQSQVLLICGSKLKRNIQSLSDIHDGSSNQRSSGISSRDSTPLSAHLDISVKLAQLKSDLHILRRQQQLNMEAMRDEFMAASAKIKKVLTSIPGVENQVNFYKRNESAIAKRNYLSGKEQVEKELSDLEASVEELRADVISRQCRVNTSDVEGMALLLSNITKSLADLKAQFPEIQSIMKNVMDAELRIVVSEEKFLKEEPTEIEYSLKRCKKITGTLYTLKRLASVQDHRPPHVPNMAATAGSSLPDQKKALLDNIRSLVPDHEQRVKEMEAADASRERKKKISSQQEALKFGKSLEMATKNLRPPSLTDVRGETYDEDGENGYINDIEGQLDQGKLVVTKLGNSSSVTTHPSSMTTVSSKMPTSVTSSSVKTSLPLASTAVKPLDKPTATVSAMTAGVSDTITMMATKTADKEFSPSIINNGSISVTQTTDSLTSSNRERNQTETNSVKVGTTESPKKKAATVYTYQISGTTNPVFPVPPPMFNPDGMDGSPTMLEFKDKQFNVHTFQESSNREMNVFPGLALNKGSSNKGRQGTVSDFPVASTSRDSSISPPNENADNKIGTTHRQAARSAFFSSLNTPPDSPLLSSPDRNSAGLELGPVLSPTGQSGNIMQGTTINLVLSGIASPKSSTSSGAFTVALPSDVRAHVSTENKTTSSQQNSPVHGISHPVSGSKPLSPEAHPSTASDTKQKKVPPPPPPRKDSRPTSVSISPVNGDPQDISVQQSRDMPRFVGGILGQHRLSGGPLFSTPKPVPQQKPASRFEQDIASGIYANMNRPDVQSQKSTPQEMISTANIPSNAKSIKSSSQSSTDDGMSIPPPPSVTIALGREERGSSSESSGSSSSSGTSIGSQQSVVSVVRSQSISDKGSSKSKPDPPKRQSSLLSKLTGNKESKNKLNNGKAKANGVDL